MLSFGMIDLKKPKMAINSHKRMFKTYLEFVMNSIIDINYNLLHNYNNYIVIKYVCTAFT